MSGNVVATKALVGTLMGIAKWVYIIGSIVLVCYSAYFLFTKMNRPIAGLLVFLGGAMAALFYYVKWFMGADKKPELNAGLCPDFLTPVSPGAGASISNPSASKTIYCMDFVGVSRNGALRVADPQAVDTQVRDTTWYSLPINTSDVSSQRGLNNLQAKVQAKGLTWVGLFPDM
jgi:hypothetical protein